MDLAGILNSTGLIATTVPGDAVDGTSTNHWGGHFLSTNFGGLFAMSTNGTGIVGISASNANPALALQATGTGPLISASNPSNSPVLTLDQKGNLTIAGTLTQAAPCKIGCAAQSSGRANRVVSYASQASTPVTEDFGEARLINGVANVPLDSAFANVIDQHSNYMVFVMPNGDNRGLYVAQRSNAGFSVRESNGGRSNITFSYRIVAKPYGSQAPRLPMMSVRQGAL